MPENIYVETNQQNKDISVQVCRKMAHVTNFPCGGSAARKPVPFSRYEAATAMAIASHLISPYDY